jgi:hypothetical protein
MASTISFRDNTPLVMKDAALNPEPYNGRLQGYFGGGGVKLIKSLETKYGGRHPS